MTVGLPLRPKRSRPCPPAIRRASLRRSRGFGTLCRSKTVFEGGDPCRQRRDASGHDGAFRHAHRGDARQLYSVPGGLYARVDTLRGKNPGGTPGYHRSDGLYGAFQPDGHVRNHCECQRKPAARCIPHTVRAGQRHTPLSAGRTPPAAARLRCRSLGRLGLEAPVLEAFLKIAGVLCGEDYIKDGRTLENLGFPPEMTLAEIYKRI